MGWLATPERMMKPDRIRFRFLFLAAAAFFITEFGRFVYRPYIRQHHIDDFGLAGSIGNLGGIVVQIFATLAVLNASQRQGYRIAFLLCAAYIAYEFIQPFLPRGVFDWNDVLATIIGAGISILLIRFIRFPPPDDGKGTQIQPRELFSRRR